MIGQVFKITVDFGLETKDIWATVIQYLQNNQYVLEDDNGNRYIRTLVWVR